MINYIIIIAIAGLILNAISDKIKINYLEDSKDMLIKELGEIYKKLK